MAQTTVEIDNGPSGPDSLRILMVAPTSFFGHYGGHIRILEEARSLQERGHEVTIVTYYKGQDVPGLSIERTAPLPWRPEYEVGSSRHKLAFDAYLAHKVLQVGRRVRPHVVHGHMHEGALLGALLARLQRAPLIFDFQGSLTGEMLDHRFIKPHSLGHRLWHRLERFICHLPQKIFTSSLQARDLLQNGFGVPPQRIVPLPDCADLDHFSAQKVTEQQKARLRQRFGIPPDRPVVAYLGLLADYQGTPHLLRAATRLKERDVDVHFLIMGYPNEDRYAAQAHNLGLSDRVTFTGKVDYVKDAPQFLALGDVAVSPKMSSSEGSGKVLNYMAMGQPVVAFDSKVHREYLGEDGVYVPSGDIEGLAQAIEALLQDRQRRCTLGEALRQRAATRFSWEAAAMQIESVYARVLRDAATELR
ncbi:MAG TPA: glycosyltransferase family 4 protein [Candidatus Sulfomarinibacteraceae bacterium]|nr:glycosyltransferase family 4 protein [Candidatus Sulfomarinibacteraceae bacterium]